MVSFLTEIYVKDRKAIENFEERFTDMQNTLNKEAKEEALKPERVIFRKFKGGDIVAFFPDQQESNGFIGSYQHVGQHSAADYSCLLSISTLATSDEYQGLLTELESIGYNLRIVKKYNRN